MDSVKLLRNQRGMSLVAVLVALGISVIIGFAVVESLLQAKKVEGLAEQNLEVQDWIRAVEVVIINKNSCTETLMAANGKAPIDPQALKTDDGLEIQKIVDWVPSPGVSRSFVEKGWGLFQSGPPTPNAPARLVVNKMFLTIDKAALVPANSFVRAKLNFLIEKTNSSNQLGGAFFNRSTSLLAGTDENARITSCTVIDEAQMKRLVEGICETLGGQYASGGSSGSSCNLASSRNLLDVVCNSFNLSPNYQTMKCY